MDPEEDKTFLFDMTKILKHFYETPVIFITKKDYSDNIFNSLCAIRKALLNDSKKEMIDDIADFHLKWLHAVNDVENFLQRISDISREEVYQAISYTIDAMSYRLKYFQIYMENNRTSLTNAQKVNILADMEIAEEMHKDVTHVLLDKLKCFRNYSPHDDFIVKVKDATEELLLWVDKINDELSLILCKHIQGHMPHLKISLIKALQQIVEEMQSSNSDHAQLLIEALKKKGKDINTMIRGTTGRNLEISKVIEKIAILDDRIQRLEHEPLSAALMALQHKKDYLEKRLNSLENLRVNLKSLHRLHDVDVEQLPEDDTCVCEDFYQFKIFNHLLPPVERDRLITELCYLWDLAVFGERSHLSIISILSAAENKEEFTDELGTFYIDKHSRKIYKLPEDETLYQANENNELVPLSDDTDHIYFYDECGRYYVDNKTRQRVYKAHTTASEYLLDSTGIILKIKEDRDGRTYYYDNYGRYYINEEGKHIYRDVDSTSEYENDGLGNLVRIRSQLDLLRLCPDDVNVTEEFKYLKQTVGAALRECIANVILHQPADPIKYLSASLIKYRENIELRDKRNREKEELNVEREIRLADERAEAERAAMDAALTAQGGSEASYDLNFVKYASIHQDEVISNGSTV